MKLLKHSLRDTFPVAIEQKELREVHPRNVDRHVILETDHYAELEDPTLSDER